MKKTTKGTKLMMMAFATALTAVSLAFPKTAEAYCMLSFTEEVYYYATPTSKFPVGSCYRDCPGNTTCEGTQTEYYRVEKQYCELCW